MSIVEKTDTDSPKYAIVKKVHKTEFFKCNNLLVQVS